MPAHTNTPDCACWGCINERLLSSIPDQMGASTASEPEPRTAIVEIDILPDLSKFTGLLASVARKASREHIADGHRIVHKPKADPTSPFDGDAATLFGLQLPKLKAAAAERVRGQLSLDNWLGAFARQTAAKALRDAASDIRTTWPRAELSGIGSVVFGSPASIAKHLTDRASRIEAGDD